MQLSAYLDVFNVYDRDNAQGYSYAVLYRNGALSVQRHIEPLLPRLPSIGVAWDF